ncbi:MULTISPECIES: ankyrin repeat domain-containing protein [Aquimarina]|uniref:Ankyrin repeat domain-containing protein n=1 Tax=Aquimarina algiphila TaxID=2047982 RepID=A0A554VIG3_9FLAO|nr:MULTISPECIES: ankyrin repeat domain-containing protein [Aquimarina]TSE07452.1 ankyrin repeat domain-containing protein [Aquimarina algiphila]
MKKLIVLMLCMVVSFAFATDPVKNDNGYKVKKTEIISVSPFCISIAKGDYEMVKKMIELGTEVNKYSEGMTPLMYAARYNRLEIIKLLVSNGAKINTKNDKGFNALKYAELSGAVDAKKLLLELKKK